MTLCMKNRLFFALISIATCALSTGAAAQKVYRCGSAYSQTPCPDALVVEVEDTRSKAEKSESDARVRREAASADAMEKQRLHDEAQAMANGNAKTNSRTKNGARNGKSARQTPSSAADATHPTGPNAKKPKSKQKTPEFFTARSIADTKNTKP